MKFEDRSPARRSQDCEELAAKCIAAARSCNHLALKLSHLSQPDALYVMLGNRDYYIRCARAWRNSI